MWHSTPCVSDHGIVTSRALGAESVGKMSYSWKLPALGNLEVITCILLHLYFSHVLIKMLQSSILQSKKINRVVKDMSWGKHLFGPGFYATIF